MPRYGTRSEINTAIFLSLGGSFIIVGLGCYYGYKSEFPHKEPGASIWIAIVPAALFLFAICAYFFPKQDKRPRRKCPKCNTEFLSEDILTGKTLLNSSTYRGTRMEKGEVKNLSGQVIGTTEYSVPYSHETYTYNYHYRCKKCSYTWTQ